MRILHLVPGSGGTFYCQNCLRDHVLIRALRRAGHDVMLTPLYLPMYGGETAAETSAPLFFGGIGVYAREKLPFLRRMPEWLNRALNAPALLRRAALREGSTSAAELGAMTLSMLEGRQGNQCQEFERFLDWLRTQPRPDIVHISNALLLGFVPALAEAFDAAFVCSLQDEEPWVNGMRAPYDTLCWEAMARHARQVGCFVATSHWYGERMRARLALREDQIRVIHPGIDIPDAPSPPAADAPPTLGYLSRLHPAQGFEDVVNAFITLRQEEPLRALRLRATGGATPADMPFLGKMEALLGRSDALRDAAIHHDFKSAPDASFFNGIHVMSSPSREGEAFGMHIVEAFARGIPVAQPRLGAYPEIIEASGGGLLYDPATPGALAGALRELLTRPDFAREMGLRGYAYARDHFSAERMARDMAALYAGLR